MNSSVAAHVAAIVARRTGVPLDLSMPAADVIRLAPSGYSEQESFSVEVRTGWRSAEAVFVPGSFARPLIRRMGEAPAESRIAFSALAAVAARQWRLVIRINGAEFSPEEHEKWPAEWTGFELGLRRHGLVFEEMPPAEAATALTGLAAPIFGMVIALVGVDDFEADDSALEGDVTEQVSRRYERRPVNREVCLALKGRRCWCCNLDFGLVYGEDAEGFIEVHHRVPVSGMGPGYRVHPIRDLFPVCSNCHSVIHLVRPPADPDELRRRLQPASTTP